MRSNKSKEFFAELKVLCKIHHINVVSHYLKGMFVTFGLICYLAANLKQFRWSYLGMLAEMTIST